MRGRFCFAIVVTVALAACDRDGGRARENSVAAAPAAIPTDPAPAQFTVSGKPWSLVFSRHPRIPSQQAVWLFNEEKGELWEMIGTENFVLRPRVVDSPAPPAPARR